MNKLLTFVFTLGIAIATAKADETKRIYIALTPVLAAAHRTTHIETDFESIPLTDKGAVPVNFTRQQMQTYRLNLK